MKTEKKVAKEKELKEIYEGMSEELPLRELEEDGDGATPKSLDERESEAPDLSDLQSMLARLFPEFDHDDINSLASAVMVARIAPDVFSDLIYLNTISILQKQDPAKNIDVTGTITKIYAIMSIGLEGKGRIDQIEAYGSAREEKDLEKLSRELF